MGVAIIDTDVIAHEIVEPGQPALDQIRIELGQEYIDTEGRLDRRKMRNAIFSDPALKSRLEAILHPAIAAEAARQVASQDDPWCILVVPLLVESRMFPWIDRVLVVDAEESVQIERGDGQRPNKPDTGPGHSRCTGRTPAAPETGR